MQVRKTYRDVLEVIDKESTRLNKLLENFLNFARPRAPRFQPTDLAAVIDSTVSLARHSGETSQIEFRRTIDGKLPEVQCDFRTTEASASRSAPECRSCDSRRSG